MNLIHDQWIPVRKKNGAKIKIAPYQITEAIGTEEEITEIAAVRPDFNGALVQFLIGLLQTTCAPQNTGEWRRWLDSSPSSQKLKASFESIAHAFNLGGDTQRFMQETELANNEKAVRKPLSIDKLLIDIAAGKTFVKRGTLSSLCPACSATALFTLQTNAPTGGAGHLTGLRGGGPLTTLAHGDNLWALCWHNVLSHSVFMQLANGAKNDNVDKFPWLACTRLRRKGVQTTPNDVHPAQIYWAMPRRILLKFEDGGNKNCDLCGESSELLVSEFLSLPRGINYKGYWQHPLSPMYSKEEKNGVLTWLPVHQHERIAYKHWLGIVPNSEERQKRPALVIIETLSRMNTEFRIKSFGYDMDQMKARCWYEGTMPVLIAAEKIREMYDWCIKNMINSTDLGSTYLVGAITNAFKLGPKDISRIEERLSYIKTYFWEETEPEFYSTLTQLRGALEANQSVIPEQVLENWLKVVFSTAEKIFDEISQTGEFNVVDAGAVAKAWNDMQKKLHGKKMRETLGLPPR